MTRALKTRSRFPKLLGTLSRRAQLRLLKRSWARAKHSGTIDPRIPPPAINYNVKPTVRFSDYRDAFTSDACARELPALLQIGTLDRQHKSFSMLDYGCGLGRLAFAFTEEFGADPSHRYYGHEVHPEAYAFLTEAYRSFPNTRFLSEKIHLLESYVEIGQQAGAQPADPTRIDPTQVRLASKLDALVDLQFSHSVFTHMRRAPIVHVLQEMAGCVKRTGVCVNTWLVVDDFADRAMANGTADRVLPHEIDGFRTYSLENPLVCAAYPIETIQEIYREAGHDVVSIEYGRWSGRTPTQDFTYQDVVISKPTRSKPPGTVSS